MDCCDRSIIAWNAGLRMQACDIGIMLQETIFNRFGDQLPKTDQLQFLYRLHNEMSLIFVSLERLNHYYIGIIPNNQYSSLHF
jgi:hypothetical protein